MNFEPKYTDLSELRYHLERGEVNFTSLLKEFERAYAEIERLDRYESHIKNEDCDSCYYCHCNRADLEEQNKTLREALQWYADKKNWEQWEDRVAIDDSDTELSDYVKQLGADEYGGKRAREALEKTK